MVWELFYEEKQDWVTTIVGSVSLALTFALELPSTLLALISTALTLGCDLVCQGAHQVSDYLALEEWWSTEHTLWLLVLLLAMPTRIQRCGGNVRKIIVETLSMVQYTFTWGAFLFMLNGLQGGVVFGGKFFHPSMAFLAVTLQCILTTFKKFKMDTEFTGPVDHETFIGFFGMYEKAMKLEAVGFLFLATFGLPKLDLEADPTAWLVALPVLSMAYEYNTKWTELLFPSEKADTNGTPPQVAAAEAEAEAEPEKPSEEAEKKEEESKEEDAKTDKEEEVPAAEEAPPKISPVKKVVDAIGSIVCKVVGCVQCLATKILDVLTLIKDKILSLPWACIFQLVTTLGITLGVTYVYWTLTEDKLVFVAPAAAILAPKILEFLESKNCLEAKGIQIASEILKTATLGVHYYIYKTYISMPI